MSQNGEKKKEVNSSGIQYSSDFVQNYFNTFKNQNSLIYNKFVYTIVN